MESSNQTNPFNLNDKVALITGGGTGLGLGMARCFIKAGARVVITGRREDVLLQAAEDLGPNASCKIHDVTHTHEAPSLVEWVENKIGPLSILVNNAGIHLKKPAVDTAEDELLSIMNTHVIGAYALTRAAARPMMARGDGSILFITSMAAIFGIPQVAAYSAAKSAQAGLVRQLTTEFSCRGVRVNAIAPGWIESEMMFNALNGDRERKEKILSRTPMGIFGKPEDIGNAAVYLCSPAARFVTGVMLPVDGGISIGF